MTTKSAAESPSPTDLAQKGFEFVNNNKGSKWFPPVNASPSKDLVVYNSITKSKVPFIPKDGKHVSWYGCGPTVYDAAHVGHARNYVTFDILRRIMQDYFGYEVEMVMNITDIDDKIILRGRHAYLLEQKKKQINGLSRSLIDECRQALIEFARAGLGIDVPSAETLSDTLLNPSQAAKSKQVEDPKYGMKWKDAVKSLNGIKHAEETLASGASSDTRGDALALIDNTKDILAPILDKKYGHEVNDPKVFRDLAAYWEADFMQDMDRLNVRRPDVLTRVSEFVPEIVTFIEKIIENGYAYVAEESNGDAKSNSVYFDVHAFDSKPDHTYAKLEPKSRGNTELLDDGEGSLGAKLQGKRHPHHFALWKASKPGEPAWPSPWGMGRPGWHIECSVMASEILGKNIDIHSGGIDLAFPHHDNELAQSEAHFDHKQWVNYFMHAGHLHIEGSKMSKSLKNFISIKEALKVHSARQLRLLFLMQRWDAPSDYKDESMKESKAIEAKFSNFFTNVNAKLRDARHKESESDGQRHFKDAELALIEGLKRAQRLVHDALSDSFNTPRALDALKDLVSATNEYMGQRRDDVDVQAIGMVARYVTRMCRMFGLAPDTDYRTIGWGSLDVDKAGADAADGVGSKEDSILPYLRVLSNFRDQVRRAAISGECDKRTLLDLCDTVRNELLPPLDVMLDDQEDGTALIKFIDSKEWQRQKEEKEAKRREKEQQKLERAKAAEKKRLERLEKGKVAPEEMFKTEERRKEFSEWDDNGFPTKDKDGKDLSKSKRKNLEKELAKQRELHKEYLAYLEQQR